RQLAVCAAYDPDPLLRTLDADFAFAAQPVFDVEAGRAVRNLAGDINIVAVARGFHETRARAHERKSGELENLRHVDLGHSERALDQLCRRRIEDLEIARIENNSSGIAIAPYDPHATGVGETCHTENTSARRHAQCTIEADHFAVQITVVHAMKHER